MAKGDCKVCHEYCPEGELDGDGVCYDCWSLYGEGWLADDGAEA
jgi:hypothetical protein